MFVPTLCLPKGILQKHSTYQKKLLFFRYLFLYSCKFYDSSNSMIQFYDIILVYQVFSQISNDYTSYSIYNKINSCCLILYKSNKLCDLQVFSVLFINCKCSCSLIVLCIVKIVIFSDFYTVK